MRRPVAVRVGVLVLVLAGTTAARADDLNGRALFSWQQYESGDLRSDGFHQTYDLRADKFVLPPLRLRLWLRAEDDRTGYDGGLGSVEGRATRFQPGGELTYRLPRLDLQGQVDRASDSTGQGSLPDHDRALQRSVARLNWRPDGLPGLMLVTERRDVDDPLARIDRTEHFRQASLDYAWKGLSATASARRTSLDDALLAFARDSRERLGSLTWNGRLFDGRLTTMASGSVFDTALDESAGEEGALVPRRVAIAQALYALDDSPTDDRDRPPAVLAALTDGDLLRGTGIRLGLDGASFHNITVDLGRFEALDQLRIFVRDRAGNVVPFGGPVTWDVYTSDDGIRWTLLSERASTTYRVAESVYEVRFRSRVSRYYKAVNFGVNSVDTEVTEVEAFESAALGAGEMRHTDIRVGSATVNVTAAPVKKVTLDYSGLWNRVRQNSQTRPEMVNRSLDHVLSATVDPTAILSLVARVQQRELRDSRGFTQDFRGWTGIVRVRPRPDLEQSVEATRTREDNAGRESTTDGLTFRVYGRLYRVVDVTLDVGVQRQDYLTEDREADRRFVTGVVTAQVTAKLRALLNLAVQRSRYSGTTDVLLTDFQGVIPTRDDRVSLDLYYRTSSQLMVGGRLGYAASDAVSGFVQRYHVDWYPFPGGSVRLGALYDEDVDSIADRRARRFSLTPTWTVNRRVVLNLNYTTLDVTGDPSPGTKSLFATLTLIL